MRTRAKCRNCLTANALGAGVRQGAPFFNVSPFFDANTFDLTEGYTGGIMLIG